MTEKQRLEHIAAIAKTEPWTILAFPDAMARLEKIHELCGVESERSRGHRELKRPESVIVSPSK